MYSVAQGVRLIYGSIGKCSLAVGYVLHSNLLWDGFGVSPMPETGVDTSILKRFALRVFCELLAFGRLLVGFRDEFSGISGNVVIFGLFLLGFE